jgi:hypothetical protein
MEKLEQMEGKYNAFITSTLTLDEENKGCMAT